MASFDSENTAQVLPQPFWHSSGSLEEFLVVVVAQWALGLINRELFIQSWPEEYRGT